MPSSQSETFSAVQVNTRWIPVAYIDGGVRTGIIAHFRREAGAAIGRGPLSNHWGRNLAQGTGPGATLSNPRHLPPAERPQRRTLLRRAVRPSRVCAAACSLLAGWLAGWSPAGTSLSQQTAVTNPTQLNPKHTRLSLLCPAFPPSPKQPLLCLSDATELSVETTLPIFSPHLLLSDLASGTSVLRVHFTAPLACTAPLSLPPRAPN
jgi:hypothetical protein